MSYFKSHKFRHAVEGKDGSDDISKYT